MAVKASTTEVPVVKPTYREVTGTRIAPKTEYRKIRQEKGYGRKALAAVLGITTTALWNLENNTNLSSPEGKAALKALKALPSVKAKVAPAKVEAKKATAEDIL